MRAGGEPVIPEQEGWYSDPWGHHDARWISDGIPSKLVRDGQDESYDDPPDSPPSQAWVPVEPPPGSLTAADAMRADAFEAETIPSLAELDRRQGSAALTARAHPWFIARDWIPSSAAKPLTTVRKATLITAGAVAGLIALLGSYLWAVQVIGLISRPPVWGGVLIGLLFALVPPVGTYRMWRGDRRAKVPWDLRIQRVEKTAGLLGVLVLLAFVATHLS
jgi:hypothetical protein